MNRAIFRAYSIRGIAGESLTVDDMNRIGRAAGTWLQASGTAEAVVGRDYRISSPDLAASLIEGLLTAGMHLTDIGACVTPLLNFATDRAHAGAGLMVTASHNPPQYNGLKIRTDHTLQGEELEQIYQLASGVGFYQGTGTLTRASPMDAYLDAICQRVVVNRPLRLVVDAGNGAGGPIAPLLVERLGCQAIPLYCEPDGWFPNRVPDPTAPGALAELSRQVVTEEADGGLAYDGDGDRLAMVDETGRPVFADLLLSLLAREALANQPGARVVYELSCTQALAETIEASGGQAIACPVGYAFVHQEMRETAAILGGEAAGHLFFADPKFRFDDAMFATAKLVSLLSRSDKPLSALLSELPQYTLSPDLRFYCPDDKKGAAVAYVRRAFIAQGCDVDQMDGAKVSFGDGWALFRQSNTQPAVTLRCEAKTPARLAEIQRTMQDAVRQALGRVGVDVSKAR